MRIARSSVRPSRIYGMRSEYVIEHRKEVLSCSNRFASVCLSTQDSQADHAAQGVIHLVQVLGP